MLCVTGVDSKNTILHWNVSCCSCYLWFGWLVFGTDVEKCWRWGDRLADRTSDPRTNSCPSLFWCYHHCTLFWSFLSWTHVCTFFPDIVPYTYLCNLWQFSPWPVCNRREWIWLEQPETVCYRWEWIWLEQPETRTAGQHRPQPTEPVLDHGGRGVRWLAFYFEEEEYTAQLHRKHRTYHLQWSQSSQHAQFHQWIRVSCKLLVQGG